MNALTDRRGKIDDAFALGGVVDQLRNLRSASQRRRYRGAAPELPSRLKVIAIVESLVSALYPRHFGPQGLDAQSLDAFVTETLQSALRALTVQVRLELSLSATGIGAPERQPADADEIVRRFAASLPEVRALSDSDIRAGFEGDPSATSIDEIVFCFPGVVAVLRHRLAHQLYRLRTPMLARIIAEDAHSRTGIDIHPGAEIGERFFIDHGTGVVIGETAILGRNVRLYQMVTLGAKRFETDPTTGACARAMPATPSSRTMS